MYWKGIFKVCIGIAQLPQAGLGRNRALLVTVRRRWMLHCKLQPVVLSSWILCGTDGQASTWLLILECQQGAACPCQECHTRSVMTQDIKSGSDGGSRLIRDQHVVLVSWVGSVSAFV